jgi:hypothetical protein
MYNYLLVKSNIVCLIALHTSCSGRPRETRMNGSTNEEIPSMTLNILGMGGEESPSQQ